MRDSWMIGQLLEYGLEDFAALALVGERLIGFGGGNVERKGVEDGGFRIIRISRLRGAHLLLEGNGVRGRIFAILAINLAERGDAFVHDGKLVAPLPTTTTTTTTTAKPKK